MKAGNAHLFVLVQLDQKDGGNYGIFIREVTTLQYKLLRVSLLFSIVYHFLMREVAYSIYVGSSSIYLIIVRLSKPSVVFL